MMFGRLVPPGTLLAVSPKFQLNVYGGAPPVALALKLTESPTAGCVGLYERLVCGVRILKNSVIGDADPSLEARGESAHAVSMVARSE
jgi:hypothetical protein